MTFQIGVLSRADGDIENMYAWIAERSLSGAERWLRAYLDALRALARDAEMHPIASEGALAKLGVRELLFGTTSGNTYRILYLMEGDVVRILRVRGPGQAPLRKRDLPKE